jgi:hypothetical protein
MNHTSCRAHLLEGDRNSDCLAHLESCSDCAAFAARLDRLLGASPGLAPPAAPAQLAGAVLARVRAEAPVLGGGAAVGAGVLLAPRLPWRRLIFPRRTQVALVAAGAMIAAAVAGIAVQRRGDSDGFAPRLAAAAKATEARRTALVDVTGSSSVTVDTAGGAPTPAARTCPSLVSLPPLPALPQGFATDLQRQRAARQAEADNLCRQAGEARSRAAAPLHLADTALIHGSGGIAFPDGLHVRGVTQAAGQGCAAFTWEVTTRKATTWVLEPDGSLRRASAPPPGAGAGLGTLLLDPGAVSGILQQSRAVNDLGEAALDGRPVRHYRVDLPAPGDAPGVSAYTDYWVGDADALVHQLTTVSSGSLASGGDRAAWQETITFHLHDFGAPVSIPEPRGLVGDLPAPVGPAVLVYPLGVSVSFSLCSFDVKLPPLPTLPALPSLPSIPELPSLPPPPSMPAMPSMPPFPPLG